MSDPHRAGGSLSEGIVAADQRDIREGQKLSLKEVLWPPTEPLGLQAFERVETCEGAILALAFLHDGRQDVFGTAVVVAPGIALCAGHVIKEHQAQGHFEGADAAMFGLGPTAGHLHIWRIATATFSLEGDVAVLLLEYATEMPRELQISYFATCVRLPSDGDRVAALGFRPTGDRPIGELEGAFLTSSGVVSDVWPFGRDAMLPRPSFASSATTIGAMSGGAVVNPQGKLIALITSSIDPFEDEPAVTFSTLIWDGLMTMVRPTWPPKLWPDEPKYLRDLLTAEDGWRLHWSHEAQQFRYQQGGDAPHPSLYEPFETLPAPDGEG